MVRQKLNLGCGKKPLDGYFNVDVIDLPGVNQVINLNNFPWPLKKNYFDEVYCDNVLEHLDKIIPVMEEIWRISKPKAIIKILVPNFPHASSVVDPTHKTFFTYLTMDYFRVDKPDMNFYTAARFAIKKRKLIFSRHVRFLNFIVNFSEYFQKIYFVLMTSLLPAETIYFELEVVK